MLERLFTLDITLGWQQYFLLVVTLLLWNLGFYAITRKGKLLYPILALFTRKKDIEVKVEAGGNRAIDQDILALLSNTMGSGDQARIEKIAAFFKGNRSGIFSKDSLEVVHERIMRPSKSTGLNQYYITKQVNKLPDLIVDPIVGCITCMASLHGLIVFITYCVYHDLPWNPIIQLAISVPVAFLGQFFWHLLLLIEKHK